MSETQILKGFVEALEIATPATAGRLALIPLIARARTKTPESPHYLLYQQAQDMGLVSITETSDAGTVAELRVQNRGSAAVLLVEGEVLLGLKQTRVLNLTIMVPAQAN